MPTMVASNPPMRETTKKGFMEAIVYNGGNLFYDGNLALPFRLLTFNQR